MEALSLSPPLQRARGRIELRVANSRLERLFQSGSAKLMMPKTYGTMIEAVMLNTAGGITGGDSYEVLVENTSSPLLVTSQTAERFYASKTEPATIRLSLEAREGACLHWLPQETIIFDGAAVDRSINVNLSTNSTCLMADCLVFGREAMGETVRLCHFTDQWRIYRNEQLFHAESVRLRGSIEEIMETEAGGHGAKLLATIFYTGPDTELQNRRLRPFLTSCNAVCAASCWDDKLVIRLATPHIRTGRVAVHDLLCLLRSQPMPRVWQL